MADPEVFEQLQRGELPSLATWFADPVETGIAGSRLAAVEQCLRSVRTAATDLFPQRLLEIILRFWLDLDVEARYQNLYALLTGNRERAMLELGLGQLLMARRLATAWQHLDHGFELAANLLDAEDYFCVLKRHALLRQLPLQPSAAVATNLDGLLDEARIIAKLTGNNGYTLRMLTDRRDTLG
jgi:hypothetical protein